MTMAAATGLMATFALPSYGFTPDVTAAAGLTTMVPRVPMAPHGS